MGGGGLDGGGGGGVVAVWVGGGWMVGVVGVVAAVAWRWRWRPTPLKRGKVCLLFSASACFGFVWGSVRQDSEVLASCRKDLLADRQTPGEAE